MNDDDIRGSLTKVLDMRPSTRRIADCVRLVDSGLVPDDAPAGTPIPPAFLPVWFLSQNLVYGAWLLDPIAPAVEVVGMLLDAPKPTAVSAGRTGLRLLLLMFDMVAEEDESRVRAMVDAVFRESSLDGRLALADAVCGGFDPHDVGVIRSLPVIRDVWSDDDLPRTATPTPLSKMFERNEKPFAPADYDPAALPTAGVRRAPRRR